MAFCQLKKKRIVNLIKWDAHNSDSCPQLLHRDAVSPGNIIQRITSSAAGLWRCIGLGVKFPVTIAGWKSGYSKADKGCPAACRRRPQNSYTQVGGTREPEICATSHCANSNESTATSEK